MGFLAPSLRKRLHTRSLLPVVIESMPGMSRTVEQFLSTALADLPPLTVFTERILFGLKSIHKAYLLEAPLTPNLIEELAPSGTVRAIMRSTTHHALSPVDVFRYREKAYTTTVETRRYIGADKAQSLGITGKGVRVVVIDTGARLTHPQLRGIVRIHSAMKEKAGFGFDTSGHGTWCASCIAGRRAEDPALGKPVEGVAPGVELHSIQALGFGVGVGSSGDILQALQMARDLRADIVSMSLGSGDAVPQEEDPEARLVNQMTREGILVVVAAGNSGPDGGTVNTPGNADGALTVGALDMMDESVAGFSSRGPTVDNLTKPDVLAPGAVDEKGGGLGILSGTVGLLDTMADKRRQGYSPLQGTSMATPHVAGLLALGIEYARSRGNALTMDAVKTVMREKAGGQKSNVSGWGILTWDDVARAGSAR